MASNMNAPIINQTDVGLIVRKMLKRKTKRPIFLLGRGGIGKTQSIAEIAQELNLGYVDVRLLLYTESDLKGVPFVNADHTATIWLQNDILPRVERDGKEGILVFDEITSCSKSVRTAAYQLLNERRLGEYELPEGWSMVCLGNGENDGGQFNGMEGNFANRCSVYEVVASTDAWKNWAIKNGVNELVIGYVSWKPDEIHSMDPENEEEIVFASPRSWKAVSDILNEEDFDSEDLLLLSEIQSNIGKQIGGDFWAFCQYKDEAVDPSQILSGKEKKKPRRKEVLFLTVQSLVKLMYNEVTTYIEKGGIITNDNLDKDLIVKFENGIKWMLSLSSLEVKSMAIKDLLCTNKQLMQTILTNKDFLASCPELPEFAKENAAVFM